MEGGFQQSAVQQTICEGRRLQEASTIASWDEFQTSALIQKLKSSVVRSRLDRVLLPHHQARIRRKLR